MPNTKSHPEHHLHQALEREQHSAEQHTAAEKKKKKLLQVMPQEPQTAHEKALYDRAVFTWTAPEYIQHPKSKNWFLAAAIVVGIIILVDILTQDYTMALAIIVLAGVYLYIHTHHPPKEIRIVISNMGIKVGNMIFPFSSIQAFWMHYQPPHLTTLNLRVKEHFFSDIIIQLNHEDPVPIRHFLCGQIPEWEGKNERFSDVVLRLLKL